MSDKERRTTSSLRDRDAGEIGRSTPAESMLEAAISQHQAGRPSEAKRLCADILSREPENAIALHLLGFIAYQQGEAHQAIALIGKAIALQSDYAQAHNNLGNALKRLGKLDEAVASYHESLNIKPDNAVAHNNLGAALQDLGKLNEAVASYHKALTIKADFVEAHNNLGNALKGLRKLDEAVASYHKAVTIKPDYAEAHKNLGIALQDLGKLDAAIASYHKALTIQPNDAAVHNNLGNALKGVGKLDAAVASYNKALAIKPDDAAAQSNLGTVLQDLGKPDDAIASFHKALAVKPDDAAAHNNLGNALKGLGRLDDAIASYHKALTIEPNLAEAHNNLGTALRELGELDEAVASYHKALIIKPDFAAAHSNMLFCMNYGDHYSQQDILAESRRWEAAHAAPGKMRGSSFAHDRDPERRLRIGYVSPDFRIHSVSYFLDPLIGGHDRRRFEVICYAQVGSPDDVTRRYRGLADGWFSTVGMTAPAVSERIRADGIDILVDLAGHTANNRLLVFAERPAPVQVSYLGYPNTTGMSAMDYRLTDDIGDPEGRGDGLHSERLTRLPNGFLCYAPDVEAPAIAEPPAIANGFVTFGSFNTLSKVTPATVAAWARILEGSPGSRLLLKSRSLANEGTRQRYRTLFAERGIDGERLEFHARIGSKAGHLGAYGRVDIGLDTFPYNGTTTTCEALWMGVPVISLSGERHASRVGVSILTRVGLGEWIADSVEGYVAAAVALAKAPDRLVELRRDLRATMAASPLCDAAGFTRDVEAAYREMWRRWCQGV